MLNTQNTEIKKELLDIQENYTQVLAEAERGKREIKARDELITQIEE